MNRPPLPLRTLRVEAIALTDDDGLEETITVPSRVRCLPLDGADDRILTGTLTSVYCISDATGRPMWVGELAVDGGGHEYVTPESVQRAGKRPTAPRKEAAK